MVRLKHRYLLTEVIFLDNLVDSSMKAGDIQRTLKDAVAQAHGDYGMGCVTPSLQVKYFNPQTCISLIRISRDHYETLWSAMTFVTSIKKRNCILRVIHLSGTIRSCQKRLLQFNRAQLAVLLEKVSTPGERQKIEKLMSEVPSIPRV